MAPAKMTAFIEFAIRNEQEAAQMYERAAEKAAAAGQKKLLRELAATERRHEESLKALAQNPSVLDGADDPGVADLKVSDFLVDAELAPDAPVENIFIFAMKAEQRDVELYSTLAQTQTDETVRKLFTHLTGEERRHKLDLESEYDSFALREN